MQRELIYNPMDFRHFCMENGAETIFDNILNAMSDNRQSEKKRRSNEYRTVDIIYKMCYGKSQKCNYMQKEHGLYLKFNHLTQEGIDTEFKLGNSVCRKTVSNEVTRMALLNKIEVDKAVTTAIQNRWLLTLIIDDYTCIHSIHRPTSEQTSSAACMCTIVCRIFSDVPAIPLSTVEQLHHPNGVGIVDLVEEMTTLSSMHSYGQMYANAMPEWLRNTFFDPEYERHRLDVHRYQSSNNVRKLRCLDNLHLVEFVEQPLKSRTNFEEALGHVLESAISEYMSQYAVIVPGDWPAQFYTRQAVYSSCDLPTNGTNSEQQNKNHQQFPSLHEYGRSLNHGSATIADNSAFTKPLQSAVPMIGPLHISLNAREDVMVNYHCFFKYVYEKVFPHSKLAESQSLGEPH